MTLTPAPAGTILRLRTEGGLSTRSETKRPRERLVHADVVLDKVPACVHLVPQVLGNRQIAQPPQLAQIAGEQLQTLVNPVEVNHPAPAPLPAQKVIAVCPLSGEEVEVLAAGADLEGDPAGRIGAVQQSGDSQCLILSCP
jgi:hypothetical protein